MGVLDRIAGALGYVPRRDARGGRRIQQIAGATRSFEGAQWQQLRASFALSSQTINQDLYYQLDALRSRSRNLWQNNHWMKRFSTLVKTNLVGPNGITVQSRARASDGRTIDTETKRVIDRQIAGWSKPGAYDVTGKLSRSASERLLAESVARDGEFLLRIRRGYPNDYGYAVQHLAVERLDTQLNRSRRQGRNMILMGVELDDDRRPVAYWLLTAPPGSDIVHDAPGERHVRVPADEIIHGFVVNSSEQVRGIPWAHAAILGLFDTGGYQEAAIIAARVGAAKAGFFASGDARGGPYDAFDEKGNLVLDMTEPGSFSQVSEDTELLSWDPSYPHGEFGDTLKWMIRGVAAGLGTAYHSLSQDLESVSFSSSRTGANEDRDNWVSLQNWLIGAVHERLIPDFLSYQLLSGRLDGVSFANRERAFELSYLGRRWSNFDPLKDEQGNAISWAMRTKSLSQMIRDRGMEPEVVYDEIAEDIEALKARNIEPTISVAFGALDQANNVEPTP